MIGASRYYRYLKIFLVVIALAVSVVYSLEFKTLSVLH